MDTGTIISLIQESLFMIIVFGAFLGYSMMRGRQSLINLILGLYLALLISLNFPYYNFFLTESNSSNAVIMIIIFVAFTILGTILFGKLMPFGSDEPAFEGFNIKILFAIMGSILVMAYSYNALPVTDLITPGSPIQSLFAPEANFFWWLILPLIGLFFL